MANKTSPKLLLVVSMISVLAFLYLTLFYKNQGIRYKHLDTSRKVISEQSYNFQIQLMANGSYYLNVVNSTLMKHNYVKGMLRSAGRNMIIYLHYKGDFISNDILVYNRWEPHLVGQFEAYIKDHRGIQILDLGCNLGVYTLTAASLGCRVVAVDANPNNTARLLQSLKDNFLSANVTVCLNAVGNVRREVVIKLVQDNVGGSNVVETKNDSNSVKTIYMDDLIPLFDNDKEVAIKMDIESKEIEALKQSSKFFDQLNVTMVMVEWVHIKETEGAHWVIDFFLSRHFKAFTSYKKTQLMKPSTYISWQNEVFWIK